MAKKPASPKPSPTAKAAPAQKSEPVKKPAEAKKPDAPKAPVKTKTLPPSWGPGFPNMVLLLVGLAGLFGAIIAEEFFGMVPCPLCILARIPFGVIALLGLVGFGTRKFVGLSRVFIVLGGLVLLVGAGLSGYHFLVEQGWVELSAVCQADTFAASASLEEMMANAAKPAPMGNCDQASWLIKGVSVTVYNFIGSSLLGIIMLMFGWKLTAPRIVEVK